jgi:hypothetical protein
VTFSATVPGITTTAAAPLAGTVTSTIAPSATATDDAMGATISPSWTGSYPVSAPTGNATATLLPYTGAGTSGFAYEIAMVLAGAVGVAAFLV